MYMYIYYSVRLNHMSQSTMAVRKTYIQFSNRLIPGHPCCVFEKRYPCRCLLGTSIDGLMMCAVNSNFRE